MVARWRGTIPTACSVCSGSPTPLWRTSSSTTCWTRCSHGRATSSTSTRAAILLLDDERDELVARAALGIEEEVEQGVRIPVGERLRGPHRRRAAPGDPRRRRPRRRAEPDPAREGHQVAARRAAARRAATCSASSTSARSTPRDVQRRRKSSCCSSPPTGRRSRSSTRASSRPSGRARADREHPGRHRRGARAPRPRRPARGAAPADPRHPRAPTRAPCCCSTSDADELVARAAVGIEEEVEQGVRIPVGRGFAGRVAAERRPVILDDVDHADVLNPILREKGIKSLLGVPLIAAATSLGVLHVGSLDAPRGSRATTSSCSSSSPSASRSRSSARGCTRRRSSSTS